MKTINQGKVARDVVVVAASAGGLGPVRELLGKLSPGVPAGIAIVFHRNPFSDGMLLPLLQRSASFPVAEPKDGEPFEHGRAFLAPRDRHLLLDHTSFRLSRGPKLHHTRPAADALFISAAQAFGPRVLAIVLSGAGFDGAQGCVAVKAAGGVVLAQAPDEASFPFMPGHTIREDHVDAVLPLTAIEQAITALAAGHPFGGGREPGGAGAAAVMCE